MTPEEMALHACARAWVKETRDLLGWEIHERVAQAIRDFASAALRERDAAWAAAVKASGLMLSPDSDNEAWKPLRALLEEAGE